MTDVINWGAGTPGPWGADISYDWGVAQIIGCNKVRLLIADIPRHKHYDANARAIAEVPAMVMALRQFVRQIDIMSRIANLAGCDIAPVLIDFADEARVILTRIDGGKP